MATLALTATPKRPSTPTNAPASTPDLATPPPPPSPGTWRHPKIDEITRRQKALHFDERNVRQIIVNLILLIATIVTGSWITGSIETLGSLLSLPPYPNTILNFLRLFFLTNIVSSLRPLFRPKDDISDIPLTPTQRKLLGLDPSSALPPPPGTQYITPPRYRKSAPRTPISTNATPGAFRSSSSSFSSWPLSGKISTTGPVPAQGPPPSPNLGRTRTNSGSPFSPTASPLFQKAVGLGSGRDQDRDLSRRHSYGSPSGFGGSGFRAPGTLSPGGKGPSVGVSYKWLYEKSRNIGGIGAY